MKLLHRQGFSSWTLVQSPLNVDSCWQLGMVEEVPHQTGVWEVAIPTSMDECPCLFLSRALGIFQVLSLISKHTLKTQVSVPTIKDWYFLWSINWATGIWIQSFSHISPHAFPHLIYRAHSQENSADEEEPAFTSNMEKNPGFWEEHRQRGGVKYRPKSLPDPGLWEKGIWFSVYRAEKLLLLC